MRVGIHHTLRHSAVAVDTLQPTPSTMVTATNTGKILPRSRPNRSGLTSAEVDQLWPGIDQLWAEFSRNWVGFD